MSEYDHMAGVVEFFHITPAEYWDMDLMDRRALDRLHARRVQESKRR